MGSSTGQKVGEVIITALWPLIWVVYVLLAVVIFIEAAAVYLSRGILNRLDRVFKKTRNEAAG